MKTASDYREMAKQSLKARADSFDRCDTDGFVSQYCDGLNAELNNRQADILERGGQWEFQGLYDGSRRLKAKLINTKFGYAWLLHEDEEKLYGRKFIPCGQNSRVQKKLGLCELKETDEAWAKLDGGNATGFSGLSQLRVKVYRKNNNWGATAKLLKGGK